MRLSSAGVVPRFFPTVAAAVDGASAPTKMRAGFPEDALQAMTQLWKHVGRIPVVKRAVLQSRAVATVHLEWSDVDLGKRPVTERTLLLSAAGGASCLLPQLPTNLSEAGMGAIFPSPSRRRCLRFSQAGDDWYVEVWNTDTQLEVKLNTKTIHAAPLQDASLQAVSWTDDESQVVYVAERLKAKQPLVWTPGGEGTCETRGAFEVVDTWGETYADNSNTTIIKLDINAKKVTDLLPRTFTDSQSAACPAVSMDGRFVTFVTYSHTPRRLGIAFCTSRDSKLFTVTGDGKIVDNTFTRSVKCLSRSVGSERIVALAADPTSKAHLTGSSLVVLEPETAGDEDAAAPVRLRHEEIVPLVKSVSTAYEHEFPGIYASLGNRDDVQWLDGSHVLLTSVRYSHSVVYKISVTGNDKGDIALITPTSGGNWKLVDVYDGVALLAHSYTTKPPSLYLWQSDQDQAGLQLVLDGLTLVPTAIRSDVASLPTPSVIRCRANEAAHGTQSWFNAGLQVDASRSTSDLPTVVFVHGGPHSADTASFSRLLLTHALAGLNIFSVNYGGSIGFGQARIDELAGNVGTSDVRDVILAMQEAQAAGVITSDAKKLAISGGSHGGFLTAHLIGQYPGQFAAATMRNPVTNLASMPFETDIPDWCHFEGQAPSSDTAKLFAMSPMAHAQKVTTPTLIGIGQSDKRVPPPQARSWCHEVRNNGHGCTVRLLEYPNTGHALDSVNAEADFAVMSVLFLHQHLEQPQ